MTIEAPAIADLNPFATSRLPLGATLLFTVAIGLIAISLFGVQPLIIEIAANISWITTIAGLLVTTALIGYGIGPLLLVPLTDLQDNRALAPRTLWGTVTSLALTTIAYNGQVLILAVFAVGLTSTVTQMLIVLMRRLAVDHRYERMLGDIMIGPDLGILLPRPAASFIVAQWGWRALCGTSVVAIIMLAILLPRAMPTFVPPHTLSYGALLGPCGNLLRRGSMLCRRAATQALLMVAFTLFWTTVALRLAAAPFHLPQDGIRIFMLCGAAGVVVAPIAGRLVDCGLMCADTLLVHGCAATGLLMALASALLPGLSIPVMLTISVTATLLLGFDVIDDQALGRYMINTLSSEIRGRVNGLCTGALFFGAATDGGLAGMVWVHAGWIDVSVLALGFVAAAVLVSAWPTDVAYTIGATPRRH